MDTWTKWRKRLAEFAFGIAVAIVAGALTTGFGYKIGEERGWAAGYEAGEITVEKDLAEYEIAERKKMRDKLLRDIAQERRIRDEEDEQRREKEENEFRANLDQLVMERFAEQIRQASENGRKAGVESGRQDIESECRTSIGLSCRELVNAAIQGGRLWQEYSERVVLFSEKFPSKETDIISGAEAIVNIALHGRQQAKLLREQLNGLIDALKAAIEERDLERIREIVKSLRDTLDFKGDLWRKSFSILLRGEA